MASLYELTGQYRVLLDMMTDTDIDDQAIADTLEAVDGEIEIKAENYVKVMRQMEADYEALMGEADKFATRAAIIDNRIKRMKSALMTAMQSTGKVKLKTDLFELKIVGNVGVKPLILDGEVPQEYKTIIIKDDNAKIRFYLESLESAGMACNWAHLGDRGTHLQIK